MAAAMGLAGACDLLGGSGGFSNRRSGSEDMSSRDERRHSDSTEATESAIYVTGVEFAEGYDWHRDSSGGAEGCRILVFKDGNRILSVPAGGKAKASSAPDMHRLIGGHLYTDFSSSTETIISRDGEELFRYGGREMICGFLVREDGIYTLGQNRTGEGFSLRKDGAEIFSGDVGRIIGTMDNTGCESGALYEDAGDVVFCYRNTAGTTGEGYSTYYAVRGGKAEQLLIDNNIGYVYEIRYIGGVRYMVAKTQGESFKVVAYAGDRIVQLDGSVGGRHQLAGFKIISDEGNVFVKADCTYDRWESTISKLWDMSGGEYTTNHYHRALDFYVKDGIIAYAYTFGDIVNGICLVDGDGNETYSSSGGRYTVMGSACATIREGKFHLGLSPLPGVPYPVLRKGDDTDTLRFNGYITSVR